MAIDSINGVVNNQASKPQVTRKPAVEYTDVSVAAGKKAPKVEKKVKEVKEAEINKDESAEREPSREMLHQAVEDLNKKMTNSEVAFGFHEGTNRVTIKIIDKDTKEVIKELPPEKTLDLIAKAWELAGIMVDERR